MKILASVLIGVLLVAVSPRFTTAAETAVVSGVHEDTLTVAMSAGHHRDNAASEPKGSGQEAGGTMKPTEELRNEHEGVLLALRILEAICDGTASGKKPDIGHLEQLTDFLRVFVDKCHHGKEEDLLFPAMVEVGFSKDAGPIKVMLTEHEQGRGYIRGMGDAIAGLKAGEVKAAATFVENARQYIALLRQHIAKENEVLFKMADAKVPVGKQAELLKGFEKIEKERIGEGRHEQFHHMLHELSETYLQT